MNLKKYLLYPSKEEEQEMLKQQAKMAAMGEMIGNIAHQWRQPLNALSALNVGLGIKFKRGKLTVEEMNLFKEKSNDIIQNMSTTIDDFKNFFQPNKVKELFSINQAIEGAIRFVSDSYIEHKIEIIYCMNSDIEINSHRNELIQVLLNIFNNSKDALVEKSIVNPKVTISTLFSADEISIMVQDNAGGVDNEILERIFEPYFTTKFQSQGTGIGLYMSKMIIEKSMKGSLLSKNFEEGLLTIITIKRDTTDWAYNI